MLFVLNPILVFILDVISIFTASVICLVMALLYVPVMFIMNSWHGDLYFLSIFHFTMSSYIIKTSYFYVYYFFTIGHLTNRDI